MSHRIAHCNYIEMHSARAGGGGARREGEGRGEEGRRRDKGEARPVRLLVDSRVQMMSQ